MNLFINLFFVFFSAVVAKQCFDTKQNAWGWINLFCSACNAALLANKLTPGF